MPSLLPGYTRRRTNHGWVFIPPRRHSKIRKTDGPMKRRDPKHYTSNFMTREHQPIANMKQLKKYDYQDMYLFYKGNFIGEGGFQVTNKKKMYYHTEGVSLREPHRKQGHGIHLYHHLISTAIRTGVKRLYSSTSLNTHSRNMWANKLSKLYKVIPVMSKKACSYCSSCQPRVERFYIDLDKR